MVLGPPASFDNQLLLSFWSYRNGDQYLYDSSYINFRIKFNFFGKDLCSKFGDLNEPVKLFQA